MANEFWAPGGRGRVSACTMTAAGLGSGAGSGAAQRLLPRFNDRERAHDGDTRAPPPQQAKPWAFARRRGYMLLSPLDRSRGSDRRRPKGDTTSSSHATPASLPFRSLTQYSRVTTRPSCCRRRFVMVRKQPALPVPQTARRVGGTPASLMDGWMIVQCRGAPPLTSNLNPTPTGFSHSQGCARARPARRPAIPAFKHCLQNPCQKCPPAPRPVPSTEYPKKALPGAPQSKQPIHRHPTNTHPHAGHTRPPILHPHRSKVRASSNHQQRTEEVVAGVAPTADTASRSCHLPVPPSKAVSISAEGLLPEGGGSGVPFLLYGTVSQERNTRGPAALARCAAGVVSSIARRSHAAGMQRGTGRRARLIC
ncbi:hypothetical protein PLESTM_001121100 [Pleodorina starrii]|nr:hypothetical protein PLESTM_001121100 [Pleodorina starrii]